MQQVLNKYLLCTGTEYIGEGSKYVAVVTKHMEFIPLNQSSQPLHD